MSTDPTNRKKVLFVDDEQSFLDMIMNLFSLWSKGGWEIHIATNTGRALAIVQEQPIDLVVVDVLMPVMDGLQLIQLLHRRHPALPKVALTGSPDPAYREAALKAGAELFLRKPTSIEGMEQVFVTLNELIKLQPHEGFRGVMRHVGLQEVIQFECLGGKSSILEVSSGGGRGKVFIKDGQIIHAQTEDADGTTALNRILSQRGGEFSLKPFAEPPRRSLNGPWEPLLLEAARLREEQPPAPSETVFLSAKDLGHALLPREPASPMVAAPAPPAARSKPAMPAFLQPRIDEMLVCSSKGDVLYEWQCTEADAHLEMMNFASQRGQILAGKMPLGPCESFEIQNPQTRRIIAFHEDWSMLVRSSNG